MRILRLGFIRLSTPSWFRVSTAMFLLGLPLLAIAEEAAETTSANSSDWTQNPYVLIGILFAAGVIGALILSLVSAIFVRIAGNIVQQDRVGYGTAYKIALKATLIALTVAFAVGVGMRALNYKSIFPQTLGGVVNFEVVIVALIVLGLAIPSGVRKGLHVSFWVGFKVWLVIVITTVIMALASFGGVVGAIILHDVGGGDFEQFASKIGVDAVPDSIRRAWTGTTKEEEEQKAAEEAASKKKEDLLQAFLNLKATPTPAAPERTESDSTTETAVQSDTETTAGAQTSGLSDNGTSELNATPAPEPVDANTETQNSNPRPTSTTPVAPPRPKPARTAAAQRKTPVPTAQTGRVIINEETFSSYKAPGPAPAASPTP